MIPSTTTDTSWIELQFQAVSQPDAAQAEQSLLECYKCLSERLPLPFTAYYPEPTNSQEETEYRCTVVELLDPTKYLGDEIDGVFCKVRKGTFEVNLPLIDLYVPQNSRSFRLIADYCRWFGNLQTVCGGLT